MHVAATSSLARWVVSLVLPFAIGVHAVRQKSLTRSATILAVLMAAILIHCCGTYAAGMIGFFFFATKATRFRESTKRSLTVEYEDESERNWVQVIASGGPTIILSLLQCKLVGAGGLEPHLAATPRTFHTSIVHLAVLGCVACNAGDTLASEIGSVISSSPPVRIISPWRSVPIGTNGGVTAAGFFIAGVGGALVGLIHYVFILLLSSEVRSGLWVSQLIIIPIGGFAGVLGSTIDSVLGSCLQFSGTDLTSGKVTSVPGLNVKRICGRDVLDNSTVNLISSVLTGFLTPVIIFFICISMSTCIYF